MNNIIVHTWVYGIIYYYNVLSVLFRYLLFPDRVSNSSISAAAVKIKSHRVNVGVRRWNVFIFFFFCVDHWAESNEIPTRRTLLIKNILSVFERRYFNFIQASWVYVKYWNLKTLTTHLKIIKYRKELRRTNTE